MKYKLRRISLFTLALFVMAFPYAAATHAQPTKTPKSDTSGEKSRSRAVTKAELESSKQDWMNLRGKMSECRQRRVSAFVDHVNEIRRIVRKSLDNADSEKFVNQLMGLEAMFTAGAGEQKVRALIKHQFASQIIDLDRVLAEIQKVYESFDVINREITNSFLIANKIDLDLNPRSVKACRVDTSRIRHQLAQQRDKIVNQFYIATKEQLVALGAGVAAGSIGQSLSHLGDDENGPTMASALLGILGATAADMMAEEIAINAMKTRSKLTNVTRDAAGSLVGSITGTGNQFEGCDQGLLKMFRSHQNLLLSSIAAHVGVDAEFANKNLPK